VKGLLLGVGDRTQPARKASWIFTVISMANQALPADAKNRQSRSGPGRTKATIWAYLKRSIIQSHLKT
jgi:hypothetical protein